MGNKKSRPGNVPVLPSGGSIVSEVGRRVILDCQTSGMVAATGANAAGTGSGVLERRGSRIVLASRGSDLAELDDHDPLFAELQTCLRRGFRFRGELLRYDGRTVVDVRPGA
jgi:hypothetical protein